jgi:hypothetical protein
LIKFGWDKIYLLIACLLIIYGCRKEEQPDTSRFERADFIKLISEENKPDSSISIFIQYSKEWLQFGSYPINIIFTLKNVSDSIRYIQPPFGNPILGNPKIKITTEDGQDVTPFDGVPKDRSFINKYIKLEAHDSISYKLKIDYDQKFAAGAKYHIVASYTSSYALVRDRLKEHDSWSGTVKSNILDYEY